MVWFYGQQPLKVSYHLTRFGGDKHCGSGDKILLIDHVILKDHVTQVM